jgi:hypothetical protein
MTDIRAARHRVGFGVAATFLLIAAVTAVASAEEKPITYEDNVAAILTKNCATCHGDGKQEGGLNLASYAGVMKGAGGGEIVIAGRSGGSRLIEVITAPDDGERMPPEGDRVPVKLASIERPQTVRPFPVLALAASPRAPVAAVAFSPDGKHLATGGSRATPPGGCKAGRRSNSPLVGRLSCDTSLRSPLP